MSLGRDSLVGEMDVSEGSGCTGIECRAICKVRGINLWRTTREDNEEPKVHTRFIPVDLGQSLCDVGILSNLEVRNSIVMKALRI